MRIDFDRGIDDVRFGMTEPEIIAVLGLPDKIVISDERDRDLFYYGRRLILKVEEGNQGRLGWIEVHNPTARCLTIDPWAMDRQTLLQTLAEEFSDTYELEDYGRMESYTFVDHWIELQYEFGGLSAINFGVPYDSNDEPAWPLLH